MADEKLVLVERFEELRTGMRIVVKDCAGCGQLEVSVLGNLDFGEVYDGGPGGPVLPAMKNYDRLPSCREWPAELACVAERTVEQRRVFRYAADLDMERELARETAHDKPYVGPIVAAAMRMGLLPR